MGLGHGVGDDGFDEFAAFRAIATRDDVLDGFGLNFGDILDDAGAFFGGRRDRSAAFGAAIQGVFLGTVDAWWRFAAGAFVTRFTTGGFVTLVGGVDFLERRNLT